MAILRAEGLKKTYGKGDSKVEALRGVDLEVNKGEFVAIVGTSGSGKSTLLHMLGGLDRPTDGKVYIDDNDIFKLKDEALTVLRRRKIGFVFQSFNLVPVLNVMENILLPLELDGAKTDKEHIDNLIEMLGLKEQLHKLPTQLSGGQQQRVAIARALVKMPKVLLLDEPLSNLDARLRLQTREEIRRIQKETKITTIFVTHDQEEEMSICDEIVVMKDGIVNQIGAPQEVYDNPKNLFVAKFLGTPPINVFKGNVKNSALYIEDEKVLDVPGVRDGIVYAAIRPEGFKPAENGALSLELERIEVMGRDISVISHHSCCENVDIRSIISSDNVIDTRKEKVKFDLNPKKVFIFDEKTEERLY